MHGQPGRAADSAAHPFPCSSDPRRPVPSPVPARDTAPTRRGTGTRVWPCAVPSLGLCRFPGQSLPRWRPGNSVQENSGCCISAGSSRWPLPLFPLAWASTGSVSASTAFHSSSTRHSSEAVSASLAWAKAASADSESSATSPLTARQANASIRSRPSSPNAARPSSGSSPAAFREIWSSWPPA